jgi:glycosyltransferase involved in cell wall biosynthesis
MLKALIICDSILPPMVYSRGAKNILNLHRRLADLGVESHILTSTTKASSQDWTAWIKKQDFDKGIKIHVIDSPLKHFNRLWFVLTRIIYVLKTYLLWRQYRYNIIHEYGSSPILINRTGFIRYLTGVKTLITLCTTNNSISGSIRNILLLPDKVLCPNNFMRKKLAGFVPNDRLEISPIPIDDLFFNNSSDIDITENNNHIRILFFGHLDMNKGIDAFLTAMYSILTRFPEAKFMVVTPPDNDKYSTAKKRRANIRNSINSLGENAIFVEEYVEAVSLFQSSDIFIYPIATMHGTLSNPSILLEGMASGKATIVPSLPDLKEILNHENNCLLYHPGDNAMLQASIERLIKDTSLRNRIGNNARTDVLQFNTKDVSEKILGIYKTLIDGSI